MFRAHTDHLQTSFLDTVAQLSKAKQQRLETSRAGTFCREVFCCKVIGCCTRLAGYDVERMPMTWLCRGFSLDWPLTAQHTDVPNS